MTPCTECNGFGGAHEADCPAVTGRRGEPSSDALPFGGDGQDHPDPDPLGRWEDHVDHNLDEGENGYWRCADCDVRLPPMDRPTFVVRVPGGDPVSLRDIVRGDAAVSLNAAGVPEVSYVSVDPATLMGGDNYPKLQRVVELIAGGQTYAGIHKWLAMWPDIDTALREAERSAGSEFT